MSDITVTNPYSHQQQNLFVAMADPVEEKLLHMVTADPQRTPTFTPFAQGRLLPQARHRRRRVRATTRTPASPTAVTNPNSSFAWNHGGIQPEIRTTWIGWVGPGIEKKGQTDKVWTDHTDIRPTMLSLLGLKDDYVSDGRVVTEFLKGDAGPKSRRKQRRGSRRAVQAAQRVVRSVLGEHALRVDRRAREQHGGRCDLREH